jgi:hypothetical protein
MTVLSTLRVLAFAAVALMGTRSVGRAQTWTITELTCTLYNNITFHSTPIAGNPCTTVTGGYTFNVTFGATALCIQACASQLVGASVPAYAGLTTPCPNSVTVAYEGQYSKNPINPTVPIIYVTAEGTVTANPEWDLDGYGWGDCTGVSDSSEAQEAPCGTSSLWDLL